MKKLLFSLLLLPSLSLAVRGPSDPLPAGFQIFPSSAVWNENIENAVVSSSNALWMDGSNGHSFHNLHADFGTTYLGDYNGIPYNIVYATTPQITVYLTSYADESDPVPSGGLKLPTDAVCEGDPSASLNSDRHCIMVDVSSHTLYEISYATRNIVGGSTVSWNAAQLSIWDLNSNALRTADWTSSDAAGLPIMPLLVRYDEIQAGVIRHALRFTLDLTYSNPYLWPARHKANSGGPSNPPFGMRVRMKSTFTPNATLCASTTNQIIITALKKYGMILTDNGGDWFIQGAPNPNWDSNDLANCINSIIPAIAFEVLDVSTWQVSADSAEGQSPVIAPTTMQGSVEIR